MYADMVTLTSIAYEGNFRKLLNKDSWFLNFKSELVTRKLIIVNNLSSVNEFIGLVGDIDYVFVNNCKHQANHRYKLGIDENTLGYNYTMPYFVALENVKTTFILNVASDCMDDIKVTEDFIFHSVEELFSNPSCNTTMVAWTKDNYVMSYGKRVAEYEEDETSRILGIPKKTSPNFHCRANFTDQFFLGHVESLRDIDYNIDESFADRIYHGPAYGGNSFEKRMAGHQVKNGMYNCVYKGSDYYIHDNRYF